MIRKFENFEEDWEENEFEPVIKKEDSCYYVSESEIIEFINRNSNMSWNEICNYVRDNRIVGQEGRIYWVRDNFYGDGSRYYNEDQKKWIGGFFSTHPWIDRMMIVFDD